MSETVGGDVGGSKPQQAGKSHRFTSPLLLQCGPDILSACTHTTRQHRDTNPVILQKKTAALRSLQDPSWLPLCPLQRSESRWGAKPCTLRSPCTRPFSSQTTPSCRPSTRSQLTSCRDCTASARCKPCT
ncbi:unnamed protein product [Pleuronectes platessa]|uniref:Uncharacterized protein n=1 Tax=Pleuronectes platessa TaxID=8262 RepID=A0A9N7U5D3_PLEPL|nr:unnamed protein product [Pleuronectes platessa]